MMRTFVFWPMLGFSTVAMVLAGCSSQSGPAPVVHVADPAQPLPIVPSEVAPKTFVQPAPVPVQAPEPKRLAVSQSTNQDLDQAWRLPDGAEEKWITNGPAVFSLQISERAQQSAGLPTRATNRVFQHWLPGTLNQIIWTNFVTLTNGRGTAIWALRQRSPSWPATPPSVRWNRKGLMWGMKGLTALSPSWEGEGNSGQIPITALTRRHGYTRGHSMGADGFRTNLRGKKVWFLTAEDRLEQVEIVREVVRTPKQGIQQDYTLVLFNRDLPDGIDPLRVAAEVDTYKRIAVRIIPFGTAVPRPVFMTEQGGHVSASVPGFTVPTGKGGDSGSPNLLPLPGELVFLAGRATSGPSPEMQADMDELCRLEKLSPEKYQMQWVDLSAFPQY